MKTVRGALVALILVVALPLAAMATTLTVEFGEVAGQRVITSVAGDTDQIQVALINPYLNFNIGEFDGRDGWEGSVAEGSVKVPVGATRAVISDDGEVSFTVPDPQPEPVSSMLLIVEFGEVAGQRVITSVAGDTDQIQVALINPYLNFNIGEFDGRDGWEGSVAEGSVKVPVGATRAVISDDGEVSFTLPDPQPEPGVIDETPQGVEMLTDEEVAELRPETRALYEILHPGTGGPQEF